MRPKRYLVAVEKICKSYLSIPNLLVFYSDRSLRSVSHFIQYFGDIVNSSLNPPAVFKQSWSIGYILYCVIGSEIPRIVLNDAISPCWSSFGKAQCTIFILTPHLSCDTRLAGLAGAVCRD